MGFGLPKMVPPVDEVLQPSPTGKGELPPNRLYPRDFSAAAEKLDAPLSVLEVLDAAPVDAVSKPSLPRLMDKPDGEAFGAGVEVLDAPPFAAAPNFQSAMPGKRIDGAAFGAGGNRLPCGGALVAAVEALDAPPLIPPPDSALVSPNPGTPNG
jgi:hypothetical protein